MTKQEVNNILEYISLNYPSFEVNDSLFNMWLDELQQYDFVDVFNRLRDLIMSGRYEIKPPTLLYLINGLQKTSGKVDWTKGVIFCERCHKAFNYDATKPLPNEIKEHRDKCRSIDYVIKQTKKWFNKDLTRGELWGMSEEEFNQRYNKLLDYIHKHTDDEEEKTRIGYIFNPPNEEEVKKMFGIKDEEEV